MKEKTLSIVDYGMGNLRSVQKAFESFGGKCNITSKVDEILDSDGIILPGVGAFPDAMENINKLNINKALKNAAESGVPILGICLGMQLLFDESDEVRLTEGLGLIKGKIKKFDINLKIPHMGWNSLNILKNSPILEGVKDGSYAYFVHSYYAELEEDSLDADSFYGINVPAAVSKGNVFGLQFHPEKSGDAGIKMLKNFWGLL